VVLSDVPPKRRLTPNIHGAKSQTTAFFRSCLSYISYATRAAYELTSECESESYITTDVQLASLSWNKAPIWGLGPEFYYCQTVAGLLMWGSFPDERRGLSFITAAGPHQLIHSRVPVP
jgi:hypothetical protein